MLLSFPVHIQRIFQVQVMVTLSVLVGKLVEQLKSVQGIHDTQFQTPQTRYNKTVHKTVKVLQCQSRCYAVLCCCGCYVLIILVYCFICFVIVLYF